MNFARLGEHGAEIPVLQLDGGSFDLRSVTSDIDGAFLAASGWDRAHEAHAAGSLPIVENAASLRIGAPIARPIKIVCIGLNYRDRAEETHAEIPAEPVVFMKDPSTPVGPNDDVLVPRLSVKTDWEVELAVVVGSTARYLDSPDDAPAQIAGYALSHDVSEREFQIERGGQWDKSSAVANGIRGRAARRSTLSAPSSCLLGRSWIRRRLEWDCGSTVFSAKTARPPT